MAKNGYIPRKDKDKGIWLNTFANQLALLAAVFGINATPIDQRDQRCSLL